MATRRASQKGIFFFRYPFARRTENGWKCVTTTVGSKAEPDSVFELVTFGLLETHEPVRMDNARGDNRATRNIYFQE